MVDADSTLFFGSVVEYELSGGSTLDRYDGIRRLLRRSITMSIAPTMFLPFIRRKCPSMRPAM